MLQITIPPVEKWDESRMEFVQTKGQTLQLEHSLVSLSKWESKWKKIFLSNTEKTYEETLDYVKCMTLTQNVDPDVYDNLTKENIDAINTYIDDKMTATYFPNDHQSAKGSNELVSSELIYYWMIALNIPFECQKWHLNRLLTLIKFCNVKNQPPKKMSKRDLMRSNASINAARRKRYHH